jgi:hypothetical protein
MELIPTILLLGVAATPIALVGGWLAGRGHGRLGPLVSGPSGTGWWQATMPWPHGVQEDDDFKWNFGDRDEPIAGSPGPASTAVEATGVAEPPRTPQQPRPRSR